MRTNNLSRNFFPPAIAWITPLIFFPVFGRNDSFTCKVIYLGLISLLFLFALIYETVTPQQIGWKTPESRILQLLYFWYILSILFAMDPILALGGSSGRLEGFITLIFYFAIFYMGRSARRLKSSFFQGVAIAAFIVALFVLAESAGFRPYTSRVYRKIQFLQPVSTMGNRNFLGSYFVITLPVSFYLAFFEKKYLNYGIFFVCAMALAISQARGPWLGAILSFILWFVLSIKRHRLKRRDIIVILLTLGSFFILLIILHHFIALPFVDRFLSIFKDMRAFLKQGFDATSAGSHRVFVWGKSLEIIKRYPIIGVGIENMQVAMRRFYYDDVVQEIGRYLNYDKAHNEYLNIAVSAGIPALIFYLSFLFFSLQKGLKRMHHPNQEMLFICIIGYLIQAFFNISVPNVAYMFWLFLGLFSGKNTLRPRPKRRKKRLTKKQKLPSV